MTQALVQISLLVRDYDEALRFYVETLGFDLIEDALVPEQDKRWVVICPPGGQGAKILLAQASDPEQEAATGNQTGGRVFLFLATDDFERDYNIYLDRGVTFIREPASFEYGRVAVFEDLYGNLWDLIQYEAKHPFSHTVRTDPP